MKRKNGFTLIELLAIIVILAIIAVITVPIILNIIENSKQGAATDSAYGYKDAVNKWYVSKLQEDNKYTLNGGYTISEGKLNDIEIPLSGDKPTSGNLHYTNSILDGGCLTIGEYKVTFDKNGRASSAEKGECIPTIPTCPGCVFAYTTDTWYYSGTPTTLTSTQYKENYEDVISESGKNYFIGLKLNTSGTIERAFTCDAEDGTPFCLEGTTDGSKYSDNVDILNSIFPSCGASASNSNSNCNGENVHVYAYAAGYVTLDVDHGRCFASPDGSVSCSEW